MVQFYQREKASIARAQIENTLHPARNVFQQRRFTFGPVQDRVGPA